MMPELDGYGVLLRLHEEPQATAIPFVFLTARTSRADMRRGMNLGADDYLTKPFTPQELLEMVSTRLEIKEARERDYESRLETLRASVSYSLPHELRTPLTGILGYSSMLLDDYADIKESEALDMLSGIYRSGMRLYGLVEDYLLFAQLEMLATDEDKLAVLRAVPPIETRSLIQTVAMECADGRESDLRLSVVDEKVPIMQDDLKKIVMELVENAFKFSAEGAAVTVSSSKAGDRFQFVVTNQGRGMTPEQINSIGAYMQFDRRLYEQQGSGLGLVIVKRLAGVYRGDLTVQSIPDDTTTVTVTLPT
jgi:signal transduction histidine kinase